MCLFNLASFLVKCFQPVVQTVVVRWPFFKRQADLLISPDLMANVEIGLPWSSARQEDLADGDGSKPWYPW